MIALVGCVAGPPSVEAHRIEGGIEVSADRPVRRVEIATAEGLPVASRTLAAPSDRVALPVAPPVGARWTVRVEVAGGGLAEAVVAGPDGPVAVEIEAPAGQARREVAHGDTVEVRALPGAEGALLLTAGQAADVAVRIDGDPVAVDLRAPGDRAVVPVPLDRDRRIEVSVGGAPVAFVLRPRPLDPAVAARELTVAEVRFPADARGRADPTLPPDRVVLPWLARRPVDAPWAHQAVVLANAADAPVDVVVRAEVRDEADPVPAFRSRRPGGDRDWEAAVVRVPARGEAVAALPVFVDARAVGEGTYTRRITVTPLGAPAAVHVVERPLYVARGSRWGAPAFAVACGTSALGWGLLALGGRRFLRATPTSDLVTIGLFGALTFVVGAAFQLVGMGVGAVLGPFAPLLTGLPDDAFRAVLLGTLITLVPRPGVVAAATVVGFLMRGLALGSFHPADLLFLGTAVLLHEAALWIAGPSRGRGGWLRLTLGLGGANVVAVLLGLATTAVLYRLYFAAWYVALLALLPGFLYVAVGCRLAVPVARSLARVAP